MTRTRRSHRKSWWNMGVSTASLALVAIVFSGCSGGSSASSTTGTGTGSTGSSGSNVVSVSVNPGPAAAVGQPEVDLLYASVTVCAPGSTTQCQTIDGIQVDTGSFGLRILASALTISLSQQNDANGNPIAECYEFEDGNTWGPVQTADVTVGGEKASSLPIQVVGSSSANVANVPSSCSNVGPIEDDLASLGANGIIGIGNFVQDCGEGCTVSGAENPGLYYTCPTSGCVVTTEAMASQVANPVASFATDNNGVIIELPSVSGSEASVSGSLIFGIGTESNNGLSSATVYTIDPNTGNFSTTFNGTAYTDAAFIDSGSNAYYFNDGSIPTCSDLTFWYCPAATVNLTATNQGMNGATGTVSFSIANADNLTSNVNNGVVPDLGGPISVNFFDWGLPFFFGRNVYVAIDGATTSGGQGPYWAY
jgi:Protein of unknown function (DUF3443)